MAFEYEDAAFIGTLISHLLLGLYIAIFGICVRMTQVRKAQFTAVDLGIIALFIFTVVTVLLDTIAQFYLFRRGPELPPWIGSMTAATSSLSVTLDFLSQGILIYRCWMVWNRFAWVAVPPGLLALTSWVCGLAVTIDLASFNDSFGRVGKAWWVPLGTSSMALSLCVNAMVSLLMISRIWYVFRQAMRYADDIFEDPVSWIVSVLLESAVLLFVAQLIYLVLYHMKHVAFALVAGPVTIIYGLNCTAIMVRVRMNRSYETMTTKCLPGTIAFASHPSIPEEAQGNSAPGNFTKWEAESRDKTLNDFLNHSEQANTQPGLRDVWSC